ncbi:MAG: allantoicase, partial [Nocardioidaceae bacterium]|nr:allantoicase [Nocardioidaceae bacterium]
MPDVPERPAFMALPDLASRLLAGSVVAANDELFAQRENLIRPEPPVFVAHEFGHKGKVYDGWETRRRREPGHDWTIVRLGVPGVVHGVVVDTAWFTGNYPPHISVEAALVEGYPSADELELADWVDLVAKSPARGDTANAYDVHDERIWTHVRLSIYPDGGVARLRVHGEPAPDPRFLTGTVDLAALENGGRLVDCSDAFYTSPQNLIMPGRALSMGEGWENARRRDDGNDFAVFRLADEGVVRHVEIDTSYFVGNAPGWVRLSACHASGQVPETVGAAEPLGGADWWDLVAKTRSQPDTRHRFVVDDSRPVTHVRLDVYPDGGLARLRVWGDLTPAALGALATPT